MSKPIKDLPFADDRRAAALLVHWLDDNADGQKQVLMEADSQDRTPFLIYSILNLVLDTCPVLISKAPEIRERLLSLAYSEVHESLMAADNPDADDHVNLDDIGPWNLDPEDPEQ